MMTYVTMNGNLVSSTGYATLDVIDGEISVNVDRISILADDPNHYIELVNGLAVTRELVEVTVIRDGRFLTAQCFVELHGLGCVARGRITADWQ